MPTTFSPAYQSLYEAGLNRIRQQTARQRALATNAAAARGVNTSGVAELPLGDINEAAVDAEANLSADVAGQQKDEELMQKRFEQQKELLQMQGSLAEAAQDRLYNRERRDRKSALISNLIGAGLGAGATYMALKR